MLLCKYIALFKRETDLRLTYVAATCCILPFSFMKVS